MPTKAKRNDSSCLNNVTWRLPVLIRAMPPRDNSASDNSARWQLYRIMIAASLFVARTVKNHGVEAGEVMSVPSPHSARPDCAPKAPIFT